MKKSKQKPTIGLMLRILRRESPTSDCYWQNIIFETTNKNATIATALTAINDAGTYKDIDQRPVTPIRWQCSCLQKKCGACAMVINGVPRLACDAPLREFKKQVTIEPLHKFPIVADLEVDRTILFENLKEMQLWSRAAAPVPEKKAELVYEASRCLQCGCCLEVCPNVTFAGDFFGAAAFVPAAKLLSTLPKEERAALQARYNIHVFAGCAKALSCKNICPAGIDTENMLLHSNAVALLRRKGGVV